MATRAKFQPDGYKDPVFAALFAVNCLAVVGWIGYSATSGLYSAAYQSSSGASSLLQEGHTAVSPAAAGITVTVLSVMLSTGAAAGWLALLQMAPETMVYISLYAWVVLLALVAILCFVAYQFVGGAISLLAAALMVCMIMVSGKQIKFTATCFKCVADIYKTQPSVFLVAVLVVFLQCAWQIISVAALSPAVYQENEGKSSSHAGALILLILSYYWGAQVFSNILHISCCGVIGRWYFNTEVEDAVNLATKQAFTNYFGSVCFGSLLVAIIQTLKFLVEQRRSESESGERSPAEAIITCVLACVLRILEEMARIFNTFAFVVCAIYGTDYIEGGKEGLRVLGQSGCHVLLSYNYASIVCTMGALMGAAIVGLATGALAALFGLSGAFPLGLGLLGFFMTFFIMCVVSRMVESGCDTLFVCFAEEPGKLRDSASELQQTFDEVKALRVQRD